MATKLALDPRLIDQARRLGRHKTKKAAVTAALEEYVRRMRQMRIQAHFGTIEFDPDYDHKASRAHR